MIYVVIPAWGPHYVDMATRYTIPAVLAALNGRQARFIVYTDGRKRIEPLLHDAEYHPPPDAGFPGLKLAHSGAIQLAPNGATVLLLNSDIVISREAFDVAERVFHGSARVIASLGVRSLIAQEQPPIGGSAAEVFDWAWRNKHPITKDCIWGTGKTSIPTTIFFEERGSVSVRCFHLHPFFVLKDRTLKFNGTIDDDLMCRYGQHEIYVARDLEIGFAELSPISKMFASRAPIMIENVTDFARRRKFVPQHVNNFSHTIRIVGDGPVNCHPADVIQSRLRTQ